MNGKEIKMELDTVSVVSVISQENFHEIFDPLQPCRIKLRIYSGEKLKPLGVMDVTVVHNRQNLNDWLSIKNIMHVSNVKIDCKTNVQSILDKYT